MFPFSVFFSYSHFSSSLVFFLALTHIFFTFILLCSCHSPCFPSIFFSLLLLFFPNFLSPLHSLFSSTFSLLGRHFSVTWP